MQHILHHILVYFLISQRAGELNPEFNIIDRTPAVQRLYMLFHAAGVEEVTASQLRHLLHDGEILEANSTGGVHALWRVLHPARWIRLDPNYNSG